jgi:hypothetical protein
VSFLAVVATDEKETILIGGTYFLARRNFGDLKMSLEIV